MQNQRKKKWIDPFQTRLVVRLLIYAVGYQVSLWVILYTLSLCWSSMEAVTGSAARSSLAAVAVMVILVLMALMTIDAVRYVHRLVGPIYRFRKTIQAITAGEPVDLVRLRKDDFLKDMMVDFNKMLEALEQKGAVTLPERQSEPVAAAAR